MDAVEQLQDGGPPSPPQAHPLLRERACALVAEVSLASVDGIAAVSEQLGRRLLEDFPAFGQDPDLEGEMHRAIHANLWHVFERVMPTGAPETLVAPPDALRFATSVLHRGIDTSDLIQAYRVGQNLAWSWWLPRLAARVEDRDLLLEALDVSSQRMFAYVDAAIDQQVRLWDEERRRWLGRAVALRADAVRRVLRGEALVAAEVAQALDYAVDRPLLAAILWDQAAPAATEAAMSRLETIADAMALALGATRALLVPAGASSLWAWFADERRISLDVLAHAAARNLQDGQGVALGLPAHGLDGFRSSHRQALRARRLAEFAQAPAGVVRFDEVEILCMIGEDPELIGDFMRRQLGGLAAADPATERLRENVLAWLRQGGNARLAAVNLDTHKNTVLYRLQRAEEVLGHPLEEDRLGLELALTLAERLGLGLLTG